MYIHSKLMSYSLYYIVKQERSYKGDCANSAEWVNAILKLLLWTVETERTKDVKSWKGQLINGDYR